MRKSKVPLKKKQKTAVLFLFLLIFTAKHEGDLVSTVFSFKPLMMVIFIKLHYYRLLITCLNQLAVKRKKKKLGLNSLCTDG